VEERVDDGQLDDEKAEVSVDSPAGSLLAMTKMRLRKISTTTT